MSEESSNVWGCARCGEDHEVRWRKFEVPMLNGEWTHWAPCPNTQEPIVMKIVEAPKAP